MTNTLDDVIEKCKTKYGLEVTNENESRYIEFLKRQLSVHNYDLNFRVNNLKTGFKYLNLMVDKLLSFSYLIGETLIIAGYKDKTEEHTEIKRINSVNDLYLLRPAEIGCPSGKYRKRYEQYSKKQTDKRLLHLVERINSRAFRTDFQNWGEIIDELGKDEEAIQHFGQQITYEMVKKCHSPNPLTFNHGGYRVKENI